MSPQPRSTFWIVTTHVLTSGLAIPTVVGLGIMGIAHLAKIHPPFSPLTELIVSLASMLLGTGGGVLYSLHFIRRNAVHEHWPSCITPSLITYGVLAALGLALSIWQSNPRTPEAIGIRVLATLVGMAVFAGLTASGLNQMSRDAVTAVGTAETAPPEADPRARKIHPRLLGSGVGFVIGFAVGVAIAVFGLGNGGVARIEWDLALFAGGFVGILGALLGLASGPIRGI
ncbi:MAG: hypothetical protein DWH91_14840 [Planctomycetota bacterium]|nr:MAG: hypothetical protein DWH91_14840 [Planctomycetota bacterium]